MSVRTSLLYSLVSRYSGLVIGLVQMVVIARLLAPEEVGIFITGSAILALLFVLVEFGLLSYIIQEKELTLERLRTAVGLCVITCLIGIAGLLTAVWAIPDVWWDPKLKQVLLLLAASILVQPIILPITAMLQRDLRFDVLFVIGLVRSLVLAGSSIILAWLGFSYLSLAIGQLLEALVGAAVAVLLGWRYAWVLPRFAGIRGLLRFGSLYAAIGGIKQVADTGIKLAVSNLLGYGAVGTFSRSERLVNLGDRLLFRGAAPVVLPILAREVREGRSLAPLYLAKISYLTVLSWPSYALTALFAEPIVRLLLGEMWLAAVPIVQILALAGLFLPMSQLSIKFFTALDRLDTYLRLQTIVQVLRLVLAGGLATVSLPAACLGLVFAQLVRAILVTRHLKQMTGCRGRALGPRLAGSAAVTAASLLLPGLVALGQGELWQHPAITLALALAGAAVGWLAAVRVLKHPIGPELLRLLTVARRRLGTRLSGGGLPASRSS